MIVSINTLERLVFSDEADEDCWLGFYRDGGVVAVDKFLDAKLTPENQATLAEWLAKG